MATPSALGDDCGRRAHLAHETIDASVLVVARTQPLGRTARTAYWPCAAAKGPGNTAVLAVTGGSDANSGRWGAPGRGRGCGRAHLPPPPPCTTAFTTSTARPPRWILSALVAAHFCLYRMCTAIAIVVPVAVERKR